MWVFCLVFLCFSLFVFVLLPNLKCCYILDKNYKKGRLKVTSVAQEEVPSGRSGAS